MKNLLRYLAFALMVGGAFAQSNLPQCKGSDASRWSNCFGEITKDGQHSYRGDFLNGREHGNGTMNVLAPNNKGDIYVGDFKNGQQNGQGTYFYGADNKSKGDKFVGEWKDGKKERGKQ
jgi:hypothetical protein